MLFNANPEPFVKAWNDLHHHAWLHGITLIATTYANSFGLLQPKEGLNPNILVSALQRGISDIVSDGGGKGRAVAVEDIGKLERAKVNDPIIGPRLNQMMRAEFPWALIAFAEGSDEEFWQVYYGLGPVFNLATMTAYSAMIIGGAVMRRLTDHPKKSLYARMDEAGKHFIEATAMLISSEH